MDLRGGEAPALNRSTLTVTARPMRYLNHAHSTLAAIIMVVAPLAVFGQGPDTLEVELKPKTQAHPFFGRGEDSCYVIDGLEARELTFVRGRRYVFHINTMDSNWILYLSRSEIGEGTEPISRGLPTRPYAYSGDYFPYTPVAQSPDLAYYQSSRHIFAGGKIHIVDSLPSAVNESDATTAASLRARAWIAGEGSRVTIQYSLTRPGVLRFELFDGLGRSITTKDLGEHTAGERINSIDLWKLPSGFYLYRLTMLSDRSSVTGTLRIAR
jgi:hypothetical protein